MVWTDGPLNWRMLWTDESLNRWVLWTAGSLNRRMLWTDGSLNRRMLWTGVCSEPACVLNRRMLWARITLKMANYCQELSESVTNYFVYIIFCVENFLRVHNFLRVRVFLPHIIKWFQNNFHVFVWIIDFYVWIMSEFHCLMNNW